MNASKTALNAYTVHLAYELRNTKIKVNSAHPGWVKTDMGGDQAPMEISEGGKTSVALATLAVFAVVVIGLTCASVRHHPHSQRSASHWARPG